MENLGIDSKLLVAQLVNFAIFFFVFQKFIAKPFLAMLKKHKEEDELRVKVAHELETRQAAIDEKNKELQAEHKKALDKALAQTKKDAEVVKHEIIEEAKKEAESIIAKAHTQIESERALMVKELRQQIASVSVMTVEKALADFLTPDATQKLTKNIITYIPQGTKLEHSS